MPQQTRRSFLREATQGGAGLVILANSRSARAYAANRPAADFGRLQSQLLRLHPGLSYPYCLERRPGELWA